VNSNSGRGGIVAGLFRGPDAGERALQDLKAAGYARVEISQAGGDTNDRPDASSNVGGGETRTAAQTARFFNEHDSSASSFVNELTALGFSKHDAHDLVDGLVRGDALVTADASSDMDRAVRILTQYSGDIRYAAGTSPSGATATPLAAGDDEQRDATADQALQLRAERLVVDKTRVQHGEARIRKEVVTEMRSVDVPVTREELVIERHAVAGEDASGAALGDETVRIPLSEEQVHVSKETVVREEVEIGTRRVAGVEHVRGDVRHEELRVDDGSGGVSPRTP